MVHFRYLHFIVLVHTIKHNLYMKIYEDVIYEVSYITSDIVMFSVFQAVI